MRRLAFAAFCACAFIGIAHAQDGWRDAVAADVRAGSDYNDFRVHNPTLFLSAAGDFDGDGQPDIVRLRVNEQRQVFAVVVTDARGAREVLGRPLSELQRYGVASVPKGRVESNCYGADACPQHFLELSTDAFDVTVFESADTIYYACPSQSGYCPFGKSD